MQVKNIKQAGFTLIELIVVIVILGILAATALPKFVDLSADAGKAAAEGVAGALSSASSMNYAAGKVGNASFVALSPAGSVCTSAGLKTLVAGVTFSAAATTGSEFVIAGTGDCTTAGTGNTVSCTVTGKDGAATATIVCP